MTIDPSPIPGVFVIQYQPKTDSRGFFGRIFCRQELHEAGIEYDIVQINRSLTKVKGTVRGLHYQKAPKAEDKIVHCVRGSVFDVAVDVRQGSSTFGQWFGQTLSESNHTMLLIPKGFAHGFQALENDSLIEYFVTEFYAPEYESGYRWDEPKFAITWPLSDVTVSSKDAVWPAVKMSGKLPGTNHP